MFTSRIDVERNETFCVCLDSVCSNTFEGYQGCFDDVMFATVMGVVETVEQCLLYCAVNFNYAGISNG